jgi:protein-L-isoaspartate(D-aspartate) O-methyltransferase
VNRAADDAKTLALSNTQEAGQMDYAAARHAMVESQIRTNRVTDAALISALETVPRELFVPTRLRGIAYVDEALPLGNGRYLMEPLAFALIAQAADIRPKDVVLDIGCGTGYSTAVLARLAATVVAVEEISAFVPEANRMLADLMAHNTAVIEGPLVEGCARQAPYDAIVIEGAVEEIPDPIVQQLGEGGRLVCIVAGAGGLGKGTVVTRHGATFSRRVVFDAGTPPLPGFQRRPTFAF